MEKNKKVLILADSFQVFFRIYQSIHQVSEIQICGLLCNNEKKPRLKFYYSIIRALLQLNFKEFIIYFKSIKISFKPLHSQSVMAWLEGQGFDFALHGMGVIYKKELIQLFSVGIINSHIGILPEYRGRSVMEWSLLTGGRTGITTFLIDSGIDTGEDIIETREVSVEACSSVSEAKQYLFGLDGEMYLRALKKSMDQLGFIQEKQDWNQGKRYYVMSKLLSDLVEKHCFTSQS